MTVSKKKSKKQKTPSWAIEPFKQFLSRTERLNDVLYLSMRGISGLQGMPKIVQVIAEIEETVEHKDTQKELEHANKCAELAKNEIKTGFPLLHAQATVNLWTLLEALFYSFLCNWLKNKQDSLLNDPIQKLRIRVGEYERLEKEERISYIVELLDKELGAGLRRGINRFEALLEPFGLSGSVPDWVQQSIYELAQVRNAIVHRFAVADRQLVDSCPWLGLKTGDEVVVTHEMFIKYTEATHHYVTELICRIAEKHGVDMSRSRAVLAKSRKNGKNELPNY